MIMLRELPEHLISDTTELLVRPGISQRCIEEDVSLAGKDCLSVILGETQKECFSCSQCLFHYSCANSQCFWDGATWIGHCGPLSL